MRGLGLKLAVLAMGAFGALEAVAPANVRAFAVQPLVSDFGTNAGANYAFGNSALAGQFTLTSKADVSDAVAQLSFFGNTTLSNLTARIVTDNGSNFPGTSVLATNFAASGTVSGSTLPITFNFAPLTLPAGSYWLELTNNAGPGNGAQWLVASGDDMPAFVLNSGIAGTVNTRLGIQLSNGSFFVDPFSAPLFKIDGTAAATPEPASVGLLGAVGVIALRRRSRGHQ